MELRASTVDPILPAAGDEPRLRKRAPVSGEGGSPVDRTTLSDEARDEVRKLETRDREVRTHEAAHQAAGGGLAGGATFTYEVGPDGRSYAVGGEVSIRSAGGGTASAEDSIAAARQVRAAALAPGDPSAQDLAVAASAAQAEQQAVASKAREAYGGQRLHGPEQSSGAAAR